MLKRVISLIMVVCMVFTSYILFDFSSVEAQAENIYVDYGQVDNIQYGSILQCWNWSFDNIRKNMPLIAEQGFTAVQTSPIQTSKEGTNNYYNTVENTAWVYYQPINFKIERDSRNALGTKEQFELMCEEAHKYGVKVIVDTVFNHLANDSTENTINVQVPSDIRNDDSCWHSVTWNISNYDDRYDVTHNCLSGFPDLNTHSEKVQGYCIDFMKECIDAGADGFRFDAAKHIETPSDASGVSSTFWSSVLGTATYHAQQTRGITPYYYGEILGSPGGGLGINAYTDYMSVTDSSTGNDIRNAICNENAAGCIRPNTANGAAADKAVQWNESHDTYYADRASINVHDYEMKQTWAIVGTRAQVCGLYLARPNNISTTMLGDGDITAWASDEVKEINKFKNYFAGHSEYLASSGSIAYNERGNTGVVMVNVKGGSTSVSVPAHKMYDGVYTDALTGNHFTVSNGTISGTIGDSGIAVVYSYPSTVSIEKKSQAFRGDTFGTAVTYNEATSGTYSIDGEHYNSFDYGETLYVGCGVEYGAQAALAVKATGGTVTANDVNYYRKLHPDTQLNIYFDNGSTSWSKVYAYIFNEDGDKIASWPGSEMTYDSSLGLYKFEIPQGYETCGVVFSDGGSNQTPKSGSEYSFDGYSSIYKDGYFYGYNTGVKDKLYFKPSESWKSSSARFAAYIWNGSSNAWVDFKDSDGDGIYEASLPSGTWTQCIFLRMNPSSSANNWDNEWNRTGDMGLSNGHNYFMIAEGWDTSEGAWSIIDKSVVGKTSDASLCGTFNSWDKTSNQFVYTDYNKAQTKVSLSKGTYTFKLLKNEAWFGNPGTINDTTSGNGWRMCRNDSKNCTLVASGGIYTFTLNTETLKVTVDFEADENATTAPTSAVVTQPTQATQTQTEAVSGLQAGYYLVGTLNGMDCWTLDEDSADRKLAENTANAGEYMLNYTFTSGDEIKVVHYDGKAVTRWYNSSGDNYSIGSSKAGNCTLYFRPEGNSSWSYKYFTVLKNAVETQAPTEAPTEKPTEKPTEAPTVEPTEAPTQAPTQAPTVAPTQAETKLTLEEGYYMVGTLNGVDCWTLSEDSANRKLVKNTANAGEYMLNYTFTSGDEIKVVHYDGSAVTRWYNSSGDNYSIGSSKAGNCTLYFRPEGNSSWSYKYFTVLKNAVETQAPTQEPTEALTEKPTEKPTEAPTQAPTVEPTQAPTEPEVVIVENIVATPADTNCLFTYDLVDGADKYWVYQYNEDTDSWASAKSSYNNECIVKKLTGGTTYQFKVVYRKDGVISSLKEATTVTVTTQPAVAVGNLTATVDIVSATLNWEAVEGAKKYWIYKATSEDGPFYIYNSAYTNSAPVYKLRPGTTYYFKIRVLTIANGLENYSNVEDSPTITVTTKPGSLIQTSAENRTSKGATISWPKFENADKYWILYSTTTKDTSDKSQWTTLKSITDMSVTSYTFNTLKNNTTYYLTVCARYITDSGVTQTIDYLPVQVKTLYSDKNFLTFTPVDDSTVTISWSEDMEFVKLWAYAHDKDGNQISIKSTTTNSVTLINVPDMKNYTYSLYALDANGTYGYVTPDGGLEYQ